MELKTNHVVLRWLVTNRLDDMHEAQMARLLSETEQVKAARFHHASDRRTYVAAHALCRAMLSHVTGRDPYGLQFTYGPNGKPEPVCPPGTPHICINLSHTHDLAAVAMTLDREIGVDVEWIGRPAPLDVMEHFFADHERAEVSATSPSMRSRRFYDFWTMKEAYMKATGQGFSLNPVSFAVGLTPARLKLPPSGQTIATPIFFHRFSVSTGHVGAIALQGGEPVSVDAGAAKMPWLGDFNAT